MRWLLAFLVIALFSSQAFAEKIRQDPLKNNPALEKQLKLEVYRLVSLAFTFTHDDLRERMKKNIDHFTVQGCKRTFMTVFSYELERIAKLHRSYIGVEGIWKKQLHSEPFDQMKVEYVGTELGGRKIWAFYLPLTLYVSRGLHKTSYNRILGGKILEKDKDSRTYRLHLIFPIDVEATLPNGLWGEMPKTDTLCRSWHAFDQYKSEDKKPFRMKD